MAKDTFKVNRTGLASLLFAVLRPRDARSVAVNENLVRVTFAFRSRDISIGDLNAVSVKRHRHWASVSLRHASGGVTVSGLKQIDAQALGDSLESARVRWWRRTLEPQIGMLRSVHECLAQLADPPNYVRIADIRDLTRDAQSAAAGLVGQWPPSLANTPEIRMLKDILDFLEAPDRAREKANEARIANELSRSRTLFDTIEAMPLTHEQRRAVVLDDHRNLVVAAAGSGKTSVIVAKAGWLIKRGYRRPSELLLLAFARDARHEMHQRIRNRLGPAAARGVTVRTFHSLGLSIIGRAEGGPPSSFARELLRGRYDVNVFGRLPHADVPCPQCKEGRLERRENPRSGSTFFGCCNYPYCRLTRPPCPSCGIGLTERTGDHHRCRDCGELLKPCPDCDGWMETRMGQYGRFLGCSNWPDCSYTRNLRQAEEGHENRRRRRDRGQSHRTD